MKRIEIATTSAPLAIPRLTPLAAGANHCDGGLDFLFHDYTKTYDVSVIECRAGINLSGLLREPGCFYLTKRITMWIPWSSLIFLNAILKRFVDNRMEWCCYV